MLYLSRRLRLVCSLVVLFSSSVLASTDAQSPLHQSLYLNSYLAGEDVSAFREAELLTAGKAIRVERSTAPALLATAFEQFVPRLQQALTEDHAAVWQLQSEYEQLKANHLLFLAHLDQVQQTLMQGDSSSEGNRRRLNFLESYRQSTEPFFNSLDRFYQHYETRTDLQASFWERLIAIVTNVYDTFRLESYTDSIDDIIRVPSSAILRTNGLPYGRLNLPVTAPTLTPSITPSYASTDVINPAPEDLTGTDEAPLSESILALAAELNHDPVAIYRFVSNDIKREWYAGSMKGAEQTLIQRAGNDVDQASLLISLLRASSIPARYVHGVVEFSLTQLQNELQLNDANEIIKAIRTAGVPVKSVMRGGKIDAFQVEHTWVSAYVPYTNYRGATVDRSGKIWLPLDPSTKHYENTPASGILGQLQAELDELTMKYFQEVQDRNPLDSIRMLVQERIGDASYAAQLGRQEIIGGELNYLPNSLQVSVVSVTGEEPRLRDSLRHRIRIQIYESVEPTSDVLLDTTLSVSAVASQRLTLSYMPATSDDQNIVNGFGGLDAVPPYLVKLRPQLKLNGKTVSVGAAGVAMANWQRMELTLLSPSHSETVTKQVLVGGYEAIGVSAQRVVSTEDVTPVGDTEFTGARLLSQAALRYLKDWDEAEVELAALAAHTLIRPLPAVVFVGNQFTVDRVLNQPQLIHWKGVSMDAAFRMAEAFPQHSQGLPTAALYQLNSLHGSYLEHQNFERDFFVDSVSADKVIAVAHQQAIPVLELAANNAGDLTGLAHPQHVVEDIEHWLSRGYRVRVPSMPIQYMQWTGSAWVVIDETTGAQGYFLSGGLAGGQTASDSWPDYLGMALEFAYQAMIDRENTSVYRLVKVYFTDDQTGRAGEAGEKPLMVRAISKSGVPVAGAQITFQTTIGGLNFNGDQQFVATTDELGFATASFSHGRSTEVGAIYLKLDPEDKYANRVAYNSVEVFFDDEVNRVVLDEPFVVITGPGEPVDLRLALADHVSFMPATLAHIALIEAIDAYGNPVANVAVEVAAADTEPGLQPGSAAAKVYELGSNPDECSSNISVWKCGVPTLSMETPTAGVLAVGLVNGDEYDVRYNWTFSGAGVVKTHWLKTYSRHLSDVLVSYTEHVGSNGKNIGAARLNQPFPEKLSFKVQGVRSIRLGDEKYRIELVDVDFLQGPVLQVNSVKGTGGSISELTPIGIGAYEYNMTVGSDPALYQVVVSGEVPRVNGEEGSTLNLSMPLSAIYGVDLNITEIDSGEKSPAQDSVVIGPDGHSRYSVKLRHSIAPEGYDHPFKQVLILEDDQPVFNTLVESDNSAVLPTGIIFDTDKNYSAHLYLNYGTPYQVVSDPFPIKIHQEIIRSPRNQVPMYIGRAVDPVNQWVCDSNTKFLFDISHEARISLTLKDGSSGIERKIVSNEKYARGEHEITIPVSQLNDGYYQYRLEATSLLDDHTEKREGLLLFDIDIGTILPVGHAIDHNVDLFDGHLIFSRTDLSVQSRGPDLEFIRYYSSTNKSFLGPMGPGWSHNLTSFIRENGCGSVSISGGVGGGYYYPVGNGKYRPQKGLHGDLRKDDNGNYIYTAKDGTEYHYQKLTPVSRLWDLAFIKDTNNNFMAFGYAPNDDTTQPARLSTVQDASGRQLSFGYENFPTTMPQMAFERLVSVSGPYGLVFKFDYDDETRLIKATKIGADGEEISESYEYYEPPLNEGGSFLKTNNLNKITDPNGFVTEYEYNQLPIFIRGGEQVVELKSSFVKTITRQRSHGGTHQIDFGYTPDPNSGGSRFTTVNEGQGRVRSYTLNDYGSPTQIDSPAGSVQMEWAVNDVLMMSRTDERGVTTTYDYDEHGNVVVERTGQLPPTIYTYAIFPDGLIKNRVASRTGINGEITRYDYDERGNLVTIYHPTVGADSYIESFTYSDNGDKRTYIDRNGNTTSYKYDQYGYVSQLETPEYCCDSSAWNALGLQVASTNGRGASTRYDYDGLGRLVTVTNALNKVRRYTYDANGNKLTETDEENRVTRWEYNERNQPTLIERTLGRKQLEYDAFGNLVRESDWLDNKNWTRYEYDDANRQTDVYFPQDANGITRHIQKAYDGVGNLVREDHGLGRVQSYEYDALNRVTKVYDAFNELTKEIVYDDLGKSQTEYDKLRRYKVTKFDALNRAISVTEYDEKDTKLRTTTNQYDGNGNVVEAVNAVGTRTVATYDGLNRRKTEKVWGPDGLLTSRQFTYDEAGNVVEELNSRLFVTRNEYDLLNRLVSKEFPKGSGQQYRYKYDAVGNLVEETWPNGNVITSTYDALNRLTHKVDVLGSITQKSYDHNGNLLSETDANGNVTTYVYDGLNQLIVEQKPESRILHYGYDVVGNRVSVVLKDALSNDQRETRYEYDVLNRLTAEIDALGGQLTFGYDELNNLISEVDKRGNETTHEYNALNQRVKTLDPIGTTSFRYDLVGNLIQQTDRKGIVTSNKYDGLSRLLEARRDGLRLFTKTYDGESNVLSEVDSNGHKTVYVYDDANRLSVASRPESTVTQYTYDLMGNRLTEKDPDGRVTQWSYDLRNRVLTETNPGLEVTTYAYDGNGNRTRQTRPEGNTWRFTYDGANRLTAVIDPASKSTRYTYDYQDNRVSITDALNRTTLYAYDVLGRPTEVTYPDGNRIIYNRYDANGNLERMTDANGNVVQYTYDAINREISHTYTPVVALPNDVQSVATGYDLNNNVTSVVETYTNGTVRAVSQTFDNFDRLKSHTDGFGKRTQYQYDHNGNRTVLIDPDNTVTRYTFDGLNRVTSVTNLQGVTEYKYSLASLLKEVRYPNNAQMLYTHDAVGRIKSITHKQNAAQISHYAYVYDANGNRIRQEEDNGRGVEVTTYDYDNLDRLTQVSYPDVPAGSASTVIYDYDAVYNRTGETVVDAHGATAKDLTYHYNNRNQLTRIQDNLVPAQSITYSFDANGNQTSKTKSGVTESFVYDVRDHLRQVTQGGSTVGQFLYDYRGLRIEKHGARGIERYSYDGTSVLTQFDDTGATLAKYEYGGDRLLSLNHFGEGVQFYHFDALGSPVTLSRPDGTIQSRYVYDAWGHIRHQNGSSWNRFGFTGHEHDNETGLIYAKARYYDPDTGRFLSQDPWAGDVNIASSLHKYLYGYMNPTVYVDPNGRTPEQIQGAIEVAVELYRTAGNRTQLGKAGELHLERLLKASGEVIIKGPHTNPGQHKADIISFNPETGQISFFDNKIQTKKTTVSRANTFTSDDARRSNIDEARAKLRDLNIDAKLRKEIAVAIDKVGRDPSKALWVVANATPKELAEIDNKVKRLSQRLVDKGVTFADIQGDKINILSAEQSSNNGKIKGAAKTLGKALPIAGAGVSAADASVRMEAAMKEDAAYRQVMKELGITSTLFDNHSAQREAAIILAQEAGGEGGGAAGAAAVAPFSGGCGVAALLCVGGGYAIGSFAGDSIAGWLAARSFDKIARDMAPKEFDRIKKIIREMHSDRPRITIEDPSGKGGF